MLGFSKSPHVCFYACMPREKCEVLLNSIGEITFLAARNIRHLPNKLALDERARGSERDGASENWLSAKCFRFL